MLPDHRRLLNEAQGEGGGGGGGGGGRMPTSPPQLINIHSIIPVNKRLY